MAENTREIVLDILLEIERNKVFSNQLIKAVLDKYDYLSGQDKRFMKRLAEGCIERKIELDYYINQYSTVPVNKMKPLIRCLMRMGVYQLIYMDGIPDSAACNEAVKLAVKRKFGNLKGFVNGVLRKIAANKEGLVLPDAKKDPLLYLSVKYSMPEWIVGKWLELFGWDDTIVILEGIAGIHPVSVRFDTRLSEKERAHYINAWEKQGITVTRSEVLSYIYTLEGVEGVSSLEGFYDGIFTIQDISSAMSVEAAFLKDSDVCMDLCAAPGGKTMLAATKAKMVLARDVSQAKVDKIVENCERMNLMERVYTQVWDATVFDKEKEEYADVVLMDVPCSGLGVMGKKRDIKYHVTPQSLESLRLLQEQIVESSWPYVKKGGVLLYSTCTINPRENQDMVAWICEKFPFVKEEEKQILPGFTKADGFYYARLRRVEK